MGGSPVTAIFVVDGRHLELMSYLLVSSLRKHHPDREQFQMKAFLSSSSEQGLLPQTRALYEACGVGLERLPDNEGVWKKPYPHGNKILACAACEDPNVVFLDTDIVCAAPFASELALAAHQVGAVPEGVPTWGKREDQWPRAYGHFGMHVPDDRVTLMRGKKISFPPYFNAGMIAFQNSPHENGRRFGELWMETARDFDWNCGIAQKRPWLDQITLPLTIFRYGCDYKVLPGSLNFSLSNRKPEELTAENQLLHYHRLRFLTVAPQYSEILSGLKAQFNAETWGEVDAIFQQEGFLLSGNPEADID